MKVKFWTIRKRVRSSRPTVYEVRWTVDNRQFSRSFSTKAQAESFRFDLQAKLRNGEDFDSTTGLPSTRSTVTCYSVARDMLLEKWTTSAAKSRQTEIDNLAYLLSALVPANRTAPEGLRLALRSSLGRKNPKLTPTEKSHLRWLERASLPIAQVDVSVVKRVLSQLAVSAEGKTYSASIQRQRRIYLSGLFSYAVENSFTTSNPVQLVKARSFQTSTNVTMLTDIATAHKVIQDVSRPDVRSYLMTILYAGLRPSEASALRVSDLHLPVEGWGTITVKASAARSASAWTNDGSVRDSRGLKHRNNGSVRIVPIPPQLVSVLSQQCENKEDSVFVNTRGNTISESTISRHWAHVRTQHGLVHEIKRVYDLRHLAASSWIAAGLPITEVASRLGHSPEVCLRVYAHCITAHQDHYNSMIESQLP